MNFSKYSGAGNDFILIDNRDLALSESDFPYLASLCDRHEGIGADGVVLVERSNAADFRMRHINPDSTEGAMCGNGARCFAAFLAELGATAPTHRIETGGGLIETTLENELVTIRYPNSRPLPTLQSGFYSVDTGVPHAVLFVDDLANLDIDKAAKPIRYSSPAGYNVNFVRVEGERSLTIRTFERGVNGETLACGTGCMAAAIAFATRTSLKCGPIDLRVASGSTLQVDFSLDSAVNNLSLKGPARYIFKGCLPSLVQTLTMGNYESCRT